MSEKIKTLDALKEITARARANGKNIVFTNGCFDLLHRGHVHMLREAKACGDLLIVGINSDRSVR
ncbi:MAG TPA: pantoate--beta-alanine ligase, partial [Candidatus Udaeobacter sp.]|nr:pantoate--beta-alanine ligase [Candidatus Udaeobacter sp.]